MLGKSDNGSCTRPSTPFQGGLNCKRGGRSQVSTVAQLDQAGSSVYFPRSRLARVDESVMASQATRPYLHGSSLAHATWLTAAQESADVVLEACEATRAKLGMPTSTDGTSR